VGALNFLGGSEVLAGTACVRQGKTFTLQAEIGHPHGDMVLPPRRPAARYMFRDQGTWAGDKAPAIAGGARYADDVITMFLQGSTQYDALGHVWYDDTLYNGFDASTTIGGLSRASILPIAEKGVVGRGVLIDVAGFRGKDHLEDGETFTHKDFVAAAERQGVELRPRDILLLRTGWIDYFYTVEPSSFYGLREPGLIYSPELISWFHDMQIPSLVTDTLANERAPEAGATRLLLHCGLMRNLGVTFAEVCRLGELAQDCRADGQWDFLYVAAPLKVRHGAGAPVNPVVIK
jgi:kynurenine formamidase